MFDATNPRYIIYALLAITKDAMLKIGAKSGVNTLGNGEPDHLEETRQKMQAWGKASFQKQSYHVDYEQETVDIYKDFVVSLSVKPRSKGRWIFCVDPGHVQSRRKEAKI